MNTNRTLLLIAAFVAFVAEGHGQSLVVVHDPTIRFLVKDDLSPIEDAVFRSEALSKVRKQISAEVCEEAVELAGVAHGAFTKAGVKQSLLFYQYCTTGNGFGWVGLVLIEDGKVVGNFISDVGWSVGIGAVPDVNRNGLDEFTLAYSGGLHQGQGGTGVDLVEFVNGVPTGTGWYQAEQFGDTEAVTMWKLTAKPGKVPVFYKQKYFSGEGKPARRAGVNAVTKLGKPVGKFQAVK